MIQNLPGLSIPRAVSMLATIERQFKSRGIFDQYGEYFTGNSI